MASLFSYGDIKNKPRRSGFDLGNKNAFTACNDLAPLHNPANLSFCLFIGNFAFLVINSKFHRNGLLAHSLWIPLPSRVYVNITNGFLFLSI